MSANPMPTVETFRKLQWRHQNDVLEPYVRATLESLAAPVETKKVMLEVASRCGWLDKSLDYLPGAALAIGAVLKRFQEHKAGWATHTGERFEFAGRKCRRWMWQPQGKRSVLDELMG